MEKMYKPVPDVEVLRYKGTPDKPDIKIFVSHRIDLDSETIDNPLYIPVRCGAVYDERENVEMLGDDTGDNISEKRMSFCELTVQYWAWKNVKADYYGLCHYRRYISFSQEQYDKDSGESNNGCISEDFISNEAIARHCLNAESMENTIKQYDLIAIEPIPLKHLTNYDSMKNSPDYHNMDDVDMVIDVIERKYPEMIKAVEKYMRHDHRSWLYNCWIMNAELFHRYSEWLFDILFEIDRKIDSTTYSQQMHRTPGTLGERLFGIFITYVLMDKRYKVKMQPLVFFEDTTPEQHIQPFATTNNIVITSNFNNNYVPAFSVLLQSIQSHASHQFNYDIIVLSQDITENNKEILKNMIEASNISLRFVNPRRYLVNVDTYVANAVYTADMYVRILIPHILTAYEKILVLDADMICKTDVAELFMTDIGECWAAAVPDVVYCGYLNGVVPDTLRYATKVLKLSNPYHYCNTGVLLFNAQAFRQNYSMKYLQNYIHTHQFRIYEQDTLNVLLDTHMYFLDRAWNMYTYTNDAIKKCVDYAPLKDKTEYLAARKQAKIIHYAAHPKPWWVGSGDFAVDFWEMARNTPFYEVLIAEMIKQLSNLANAMPVVHEPQIYKSIPRKVADVIMPKGSIRREVAKKILPKGSKRWEMLRSIYNKIMHIA